MPMFGNVCLLYHLRRFKCESFIPQELVVSISLYYISFSSISLYISEQLS